MAPDLILGPLLRYAGSIEATLWVETDAPCEVEVHAGDRTHRSRTFHVEGHHYALIRVTGLTPGSCYEYSVALDGEKAWPKEDDPFPPPVIRTIKPDAEEFALAYGSCRVSAPHEAPYTLRRSTFKEHRYERDALYALACRMRHEPPGSWPDALLLLGDQVYADEVSAETKDFVRSRRDSKNQAPDDEVANFEEYTHLYRESWRDPAIRWLLSVVPSVMIFDDHDVNDDWNISEAWLKQIRKEPWWEERIVGAFVSYWIYQHLGNLSPNELAEDPLFEKVQKVDDAGPVLREFAREADREVGRSRWSFHRDFGRIRLLVMDSRAGRVTKEGHRSMLDADEWAWIEDHATGDFDHLLFGTSVPFLMAPGLHHLEAWNEAVCGGAWGTLAAKASEALRQALDLEHWPAFHASFDALTGLLKSIAAGERSTGGRPPASVIVLSGDVHHGYLAETHFFENGTGGNASNGAASPVYQAVGSPLRNPLGLPERLVMRAGWTRSGALAGRALARLAGVPEPGITWRLLHEEPWFDNHISTLELCGREARLAVEKTTSEDINEPRLHPLLERRLA